MEFSRSPSEKLLGLIPKDFEIIIEIEIGFQLGCEEALI